MNDLRVLIVADDPLARAGLAALLAGQPRCNVVGQVSGEDNLEAALELYGPDVAVWDLGWEPARALERISDLQDISPPVVALLPDDVHASEAWSSGVRGLLPRDTDAESLLAAATAVSHGMAVLDPRLTPTVLRTRGQLPTTPVEALTPRELQVLRLMAEGMPNKAIAHGLDISEHTVKFHVNSILSKLGAQSRTEAVIVATRLGLILL